MPIGEALPLTQQQIKSAAENYLACLHLAPDSNLLLITDRRETEADPNAYIRRAIASNLALRTPPHHQITLTSYDAGWDQAQMYEQTIKDLTKFRTSGGDMDAPTTVVYLGDTWANRAGIYDALDEFGKNNEVQAAVSLGFSTGDCRVMSQMGVDQLAAIAKANEYFLAFLKIHPEGLLNISTRDTESIAHELTLRYDTSKVPFATDTGQVGRNFSHKKGNFFLSNIPGGEVFSAPYPFENTQGSFAADGLVFTVEAGKIVSVQVPTNIDVSLIGPSQKLLVDLVRQGRHIPVAELGLGFYALAGILTYDDSSVLSKEKGGPHLGVGTDATSLSPEGPRMRDLSGDFHHTDFVLSDPVIQYVGPSSGQSIQFYPPQKK